MAKQLVHIGLAVSTVGDGKEYPAGSPPLGLVPGRSNIINIAAAVGDAYKFNENVLPQSGRYGASAFWEKHPDEYAALKVKPVQLEDAMTKLRAWLRQFQGTLVACSSSVDFWHLLHAFFATGKDCPFGTVPIDTNTIHMLNAGKKRPSTITQEVKPLHVAQARWALVTGGLMPLFGDGPARTKLKAPAPPPPPRRTAEQILRDQVRFQEALQRERGRNREAAAQWHARPGGAYRTDALGRLVFDPEVAPAPPAPRRRNPDEEDPDF